MNRLTFALIACLAAAPAAAGMADPAAHRRAGEGSAFSCPGNRNVRPTPTSLQAKVAEAFGIAPEGAHNSVLRCAGSTLMACTVGANLNCGKADTGRALPGAIAYCRDNPESDFIPMFATGHATIYDWRCAGGKAVAGKTLLSVDPQGFVAENWKPIRP